MEETERERRRTEDRDTPMTVVIGVVGAVLLFVVIVAAGALPARVERGGTARKVGVEASPELERLRAEQLAQINAYRWVQEKSGVVAIPIERAMEIVASEAADEGLRAHAPAASGRQDPPR